MTFSNSELARAMSIAERWAAQDPDRATKAEVEATINLIPTGVEEAAQSIVDQFGTRLTFGTAGLRGEIGPGPARMNRQVIIQTSAGFAKFLAERAARGETAETPTVVVGFDARTLSDVFARDAAEVFAGAGFRTILLPGPLPTPVTAFAVRHLGASAGVMITASHNPPRDNGYKVYLGDADGGSQLTSPDDAAIAALIDEVAAKPLSDVVRLPQYERAGQEIIDAYVSAAAEGLTARDRLPSDDSFTIVYTAMHGVGSATARALFSALGYPEVKVVDAQDQPDGAFPTVSFPNPEEPGALDLAYERAREVQADLIIAHDPDADRLAIALPFEGSETGYRRLTGNQLGLVLGWQAAQRFAAAGGTKGSLACTIVSSPALMKVAERYGLDYAETLSGFKWVSRVPHLVFGFEEALGYLTRPGMVRDKDGITASADLIELALDLHAKGETVWNELERATAEFGCFASTQVTVRLESAQAVGALAAQIRNDPPQAFGEAAVERLTDLLEPGMAEMPADVLRFDLAGGSRVMIRPSGTEPKLKLYLDTFSDEGDTASRTASAEAALRALEQAVITTLGL
ncbi:phospho-sugar mutase [Leucobacter chinensis]|uniref:phospho-sugar mutase n=1 Tax=Leucobacter chinensis TaxID=2851010 RepID=UPI001C2462BF|nr:phospho-sugar mutase [Leucobacter chinensis]